MPPRHTSQQVAYHIIIAYLCICPQFDVSPLRSRSVSVLFLVIPSGPSLMSGTWQGLPNDLWNECMNDLENRKKEGKDGDTWYLPPGQSEGWACAALPHISWEPAVSFSRPSSHSLSSQRNFGCVQQRMPKATVSAHTGATSWLCFGVWIRIDFKQHLPSLLSWTQSPLDVKIQSLLMSFWTACVKRAKGSVSFKKLLKRLKWFCCPRFGF